MDKKEGIKRKVKALLEKTTENGATESEAISALAKAKELMMEFFISEHELNDPYADKKCICKEIDRFKSIYDITILYPYLCTLFDCKHFYNKKSITFFGFEEDVELCIYFYRFILKACFVEKDNYVQSDGYNVLKRNYHGRTLVSSFIKGFITAMCQKLDDLYKERKQELSENTGLAIIDKIEKVREQYELMEMNVRKVKSNHKNALYYAYTEGFNKGDETLLTQGINDYHKDNTLQLTK